MSKKKNIWKILGMAGMIFGFLGTMMQGYAEDKDLDAGSTRLLRKSSTNLMRLRGSDASLSFALIFLDDAKNPFVLWKKSTN